MKTKEWFASWFDTSYYHSLYKNRDEEEAKKFIHNLAGKLNLKPNTEVLDLACGKGRHSITLNELGMNVTGVDLSANSIEIAKKAENKNLKFAVQDMRFPFENEKFEFVFNLFTSFGYFDSVEDNLKVIESVKQMLQPNGVFVIDFMNSEKVINTLVEKEVKREDDIDFHIERKYDGEHIFKHIKFSDKDESFHFTERVQALKQKDFEELLTKIGFTITNFFGNFNLDPFNSNHSDRLIIIAKLK